jgi:hypothetical protein
MENNLHSSQFNGVEVKCGGGPLWQEGVLSDLRYNEEGNQMEAEVTLNDR